MALTEVKTGTDIPVDLDTTIQGETLGALTQIVVTYYYIRSGIKTKISYHALVTTDAAVVDEALAAKRTVNALVINGTTIETVIPPKDTENLTLNNCEKVTVKSELSFTDSSGDKGKQATDSDIMTLINSVTGEL